MVIDSNGWCDGDVTATTAMEGATVTQRQRDGNGMRKINGDKWRDGNATAMKRMDGAMATAMDGATAMAMQGTMAMRC